MEILPLGDRVAIRRDDPELSPWIILPPDVVADMKMQITIGTIIATGPDVVQVGVGDRVIFSQYAGKNVRVKLDGKTVERIDIMREEDILAMVRE
ncbi:MAG: co-chaperone GroES [candidate division WOR-3 bacterium]